MDPFLGEVRLFGGTYAPRGWALCNGAILSISQNTALFSLLGTTYGGDGRTTFGLPDLQGRVPVGQGQGPGLSMYTQGQKGGVENVALTQQQIPPHTHQLSVFNGNGASKVPNAGDSIAVTNDGGRNPLQFPSFSGTAPNTALSPQSIQPAGQGAPHENRQPYIVMNYIIALQGIFPPRP